jgi:hypothetical protein
VKLPLRTSLDVLTEVIYSLVGCGTSGQQEVILHYMDTADRQGALGARYQRPYAVPEALDLLRGPLSGTVHLPSHLDWSGNAVYDLDAPGRIVDLYRAVLIEAASPQDLYAYLDERVLRRLWALLCMASGPAPEGVGAEVPGHGRDQPHHRDRVSGGRWNPGTSGSRTVRPR